MTPKQEILKRLLEEKHISFEEMLILSQKDVEYIYYNNPYFPIQTTPFYTYTTSTNTSTSNPVSISGDTTNIIRNVNN